MHLKLLVHGADGFGPMAKDIRAAIHSLDPDLAADVTRLEDNLEFWRMRRRVSSSILAGSLGALGMLLACIGVYGVVSYAVSRRGSRNWHSHGAGRGCSRGEELDSTAGHAPGGDRRVAGDCRQRRGIANSEQYAFRAQLA